MRKGNVGNQELAPRGLQEDAKRPKDGPKRPPRGPQESPRRSQEGHEKAQEVPKRTARGSEGKVRRLTVVMFPELGD